MKLPFRIRSSQGIAVTDIAFEIPFDKAEVDLCPHGVGIEAVRNLFFTLLEKSTLLFSVLSCQVISNVPSTILLSRFTDNYRALLLGVNIGGTGALIASLASLITFRTYTKENPTKVGAYLRLFALVNLVFLVLLTAFCFLLV